MEVDKKNIKESDCLLRFTKRRIKKKLGVIHLFTGETGKGKSYAGIRFLESWYEFWFKEKFPSVHICENLEQAVLLVKDFERIGEGILIEELSVLAAKRDALTVSNKLWNKFLDTCRIKQAVIVGNCPHISFIDSHFLMMCQTWVNCLGVDFKNEVVLAKPLWLQTSPHKKEPYKHRFIGDDGFEIDFCCFIKPSKEIIEEYDQIKIESNNNLYEEIMLKLRHDRLKKLEALGQKGLPEQQINAYKLALSGYSDEEGAKKMGIGRTTFNHYKQIAKGRLEQPEYSDFAKKSGFFASENECAGKKIDLLPNDKKNLTKKHK